MTLWAKVNGQYVAYATGTMVDLLGIKDLLKKGDSWRITIEPSDEVVREGVIS